MQSSYRDFTTDSHIIYARFLALKINCRKSMISSTYNLFLLALTENRSLSLDDRKLLSLPTKMGGLRILILTDMCILLKTTILRKFAKVLLKTSSCRTMATPKTTMSSQETCEHRQSRSLTSSFNSNERQ